MWFTWLSFSSFLTFDDYCVLFTTNFRGILLKNLERENKSDEWHNNIQQQQHQQSKYPITLRSLFFAEDYFEYFVDWHNTKNVGFLLSVLFCRSKQAPEIKNSIRSKKIHRVINNMEPRRKTFPRSDDDVRGGNEKLWAVTRGSLNLLELLLSEGMGSFWLKHSTHVCNIRSCGRDRPPQFGVGRTILIFFSLSNDVV